MKRRFRMNIIKGNGSPRTVRCIRWRKSWFPSSIKRPRKWTRWSRMHSSGWKWNGSLNWLEIAMRSITKLLWISSFMRWRKLMFQKTWNISTDYPSTEKMNHERIRKQEKEWIQGVQFAVCTPCIGGKIWRRKMKQELPVSENLTQNFFNIIHKAFSIFRSTFTRFI